MHRSNMKLPFKKIGEQKKPEKKSSPAF